jgi:hypothetical protein
MRQYTHAVNYCICIRLSIQLQHSTHTLGNRNKPKNPEPENGRKSRKIRRVRTSFLRDLLVAFPGKLPAKFGVQNGVVASETARKSRRIFIWRFVPLNKISVRRSNPRRTVIRAKSLD